MLYHFLTEAGINLFLEKIKFLGLGENISEGLRWKYIFKQIANLLKSYHEYFSTKLIII